MKFEPIAFKEWAVLCDALERGAQSLILRKGGIAEGRDGFRFRHAAFFLFPTLFHEQIARTTFPADTPLPCFDPATVTLRLYARVEWTRLLTDWETVQSLAPFHFWSEESIAERFHYNGPGARGQPAGVHAALLRVYRLAPPWSFPNGPQYGGCRSWIDLPEIPGDLDAAPVLDDAAHAGRAAEIRALIGEQDG